MILKVKNDIENNIFTVTITVDSLGTEQLSEDEERELLENFPSKLAYRNLTFSRNVKVSGDALEVTDDPADGTDVVTVTLPSLSNKEILIDENMEIHYSTDYTRISGSAVDGNVIKTKEFAAQAYCLVFKEVICDAIRDILEKIRVKAPGFEGENYITV